MAETLEDCFEVVKGAGVPFLVGVYLYWGLGMGLDRLQRLLMQVPSGPGSPTGCLGKDGSSEWTAYRYEKDCQGISEPFVGIQIKNRW